MVMRLDPEARVDQIITTALELSAAGHYSRVTRDMIADRLGLSGPGVLYHFRTIYHLQAEVVRAAVEREILPVVAQALVDGHPLVRDVSDDLRHRALGSVAGPYEYRLTDTAGRTYTVKACSMAEAVKGSGVEALASAVRVGRSG